MMTNMKNEICSMTKISLNSGEEVAPGIFIYDNIIENSQELIDFALSNENGWRDSRVGGGILAEGEVDKSVRNTRVFDAPAVYSNDIRWFQVSQKIWAYGNRYGIQHRAEFSNMEHLQLLHYSTEEGFYKPHIDSGAGMQRIFSGLLYLNDIEEGGETYFNKFDVAVKPKAGRLVLFPANFMYMHEARTPKSNDKFALVTWFNPVF